MATRSDLYPALAQWFEGKRRPLPWRHEDTTPWGVLLSEIMSQQTPVSRVAAPWTAWITRWPTACTFAQADSADVLRAWGNLGYPRRALRLLACARTICAKHNGELPQDEQQLRALPGIGEYTAAAVMSFGFGTRTTVLDTNIRRVLARVIQGTAGAQGNLTRAERALAESLVPHAEKESVTWNEGLMELGALVCTAQRPRCKECPLSESCRWRELGYPDAGSRTVRAQKFEGTDRQMRGRMMKVLRENSKATAHELREAARIDEERARRIIAGLLADQLIHETSRGKFSLGSPPATNSAGTNPR